MKKSAIVLAAALAVPALVGCVPAADANRQPVIKAPAAVSVGQPVSCIQTNLIHDTKVWDDYTIDFVMTDGTRYRNTLAGRCPNLGFDQRFGYKTATSSLCNVDTITVLPTSSSIPGPTCGLGPFVPVKLAGG